MSDLKSENEISNKKPIVQSHTISKSSSKYSFFIYLIKLKFYISFLF